MHPAPPHLARKRKAISARIRRHARPLDFPRTHPLHGQRTPLPNRPIAGKMLQTQEKRRPGSASHKNSLTERKRHDQWKELISRINELARKQRTTGLTAAEKEEQQRLRAAYLADIRAQVKGMLDRVRRRRRRGGTPVRRGISGKDKHR